MQIKYILLKEKFDNCLVELFIDHLRHLVMMIHYTERACHSLSSISLADESKIPDAYVIINNNKQIMIQKNKQVKNAVKNSLFMFSKIRQRKKIIFKYIIYM